MDWNSPAGRLLLEFASFLPGDRHHSVTVFGSAPLQLGIDPDFLSVDVDIFSDEDFRELISRHSLGKGQRAVYLDQCEPSTFAATPDWPVRAFTARVGKNEFCFPHPIDILVSKLPRLEEKDLAAFRLVFHKTGLPTEEQLKGALMNAVDLYRPRFAEESHASDIYANTRTVWKELYGKEIEVRNEIVTPALERRKVSHQPGAQDWKKQLGEIGRRKDS